jgi:hypothetical protein
MTETITGELVEIPQPPRTLFRTDDPAEVLEAARAVAGVLKDALTSGDMVQRVKIDGWQTLGSMLGIAPYVVWSRAIENGWEARAEARTADGRVVGAAEAMCTHAERNWARNDEYALRSMAQTRAMSKALRGPLGFIITLAGHNATPAEEVIDDEPNGPPATKRDRDNLQKAVRLLYQGDSEHEVEPHPELLTRLEKDAGGYLPRVVARAVMLVAAHRPGRGGERQPEAEAGTDDSTSQDPTPLGQTQGGDTAQEGEEVVP